MEKIQVNLEKCKEIGEIVKKLKFRPSFYQRDFISFKSNEETKLRVYLYSAAICHQTKSLVNKKLNLVGWDFIEHVFLGLAENESKLLDPTYLAGLEVEGLARKLKRLFSESGVCSLDRLEERAKFMIDIGKKLRENYSGKIRNLVGETNNFLINNGRGLYEILDKFEAFSDPLRKKIMVFIKFSLDAGLIKLKDPENLVPMTDYHMQRVLLRTGCVEVLDQTLKQKLINKEKIKSDDEIRKASIEAIKIISAVSGYTVLEMNDFFWPLGRSCCKEKTLCTDKTCNKNPCTFNLVVDLPSHSECVFQGICKGSLYVEYRKYWEPTVETHYY